MQIVHLSRRASAGINRRFRGFTAIELMVTVAIAAILAALAAPSFSSLTERWQVRQAADDLRSSIYFARSEAIKRGGNVSFAANASGWIAGWAVTSGANTLQQTVNSNGVGLAVTSNGTAQTSFDVTRWGMLALAGTGAAVAVTILVTPKGKSGSSPNAALLCVGIAGHIEAKYGASQIC